MEGEKMAKMILSLALASVLVSQAALAEVPTQALTFDTNVTIENATSTMETKIRNAEELRCRFIETNVGSNVTNDISDRVRYRGVTARAV